MGKRNKPQEPQEITKVLELREVRVRFVEDEDFNPTHRLDAKENASQKVLGKNKPTVSTRRRSLLHENDEGNKDIIEDLKLCKIEEDEPLPDEFTEKLRPSALLGDENGLTQVGFQTPRKRRSMLLKAQESASKFSPMKDEERKTPKKTPCRKDTENVPGTPRNRRVSIGGEIGATPSKGVNTPTKSALKRNEKLQEATPRSLGKSKRPIEMTPCSQRMLEPVAKTPRQVRTRTRALIQKCVAESGSDDDFSSDEEDLFEPDRNSDSSSDSSPDEDESPTEDSTVANSTSKALLSVSQLRSSSRVTRKSVKEEVNYDITSDAYFETQSTKQITSNNTLSRLRNPRLQQDTLHELLVDVDTSHHKPISELSNEYRSLAHHWLFSLWEGYNVLLYGVGSKRHLLQSIHQEVLKDCNVLLVNGFFPGVTAKQVVEDILTEILEVKDVPSNVLECVDVIESIQSKKQADPIYLLIHNLDGAVFRNDKAQTVFSYLAHIPNVYLIATIDHINAPLLWDQAKLRRFNFVWWDVTTFIAYAAETSYESSLLIQQSGAVALSSLGSVFRSLIPNAKKVFLLIAKNQLDNAKNQSFSGISFQDLYWKCRAAFLASSDKVLRAQLTEFLDHHLLKTRRGTDGVETLIIPIENCILTQFLESLEQEGNS